MKQDLAKRHPTTLLNPKWRDFIFISFLIVGGSYLVHHLTEAAAHWYKQQTWFNSTESLPIQITKFIELPTLPTSPVFSPALETTLNPVTQHDWQHYLVSPGDTLAHVFQKAGLGAESLAEVMSLDKYKSYFAKMYPGQIINIEKQAGKLVALGQPLDPVRTLYIFRDKSGDLQGTIHEKEIQTRVTFGAATIEDSLFMAGKRAKLDDALLMQLAEIFNGDIDFAHDIQPMDNFKILYEEHFVDGSKIGIGNILAVEFNNNNKPHQAIRFTNNNGEAGYYTPQGYSLKRTFIRTPVNFSRISSYFTAQRHHPLLHKIRAHKGVDYAAPTGTPVKATGNGVISFAGRKGGYGKTLIINHGTRYSTLYGHLSGFAKNIQSGKKILQGQIIGYVGSTGLATGPHLHYEFRIDGKHHDPLTVPLPQSQPIPVAHKPLFASHANELMGLLEYHERVMVASNSY